MIDMRENRMEYEANIFASQATLEDETILEYVRYGYDIQQIAMAMPPTGTGFALRSLMK